MKNSTLCIGVGWVNKSFNVMRGLWLPMIKLLFNSGHDYRLPHLARMWKDKEDAQTDKLQWGSKDWINPVFEQ